MNDGVLLADCVVDSLVKLSFIDKAQWKKEGTRELYYPVTFTLTGTRASTMAFIITISNGRHTITKSSLWLFERRFKKKFTQIFTDCVVA